MRVAVVHYHYRPGGVTRVVENTFESIRGRGITAIAISGEPYQGGKMPVRLQQGLRYSQANEKISPGPLWYSLKMAARQALGGEPNVWHFHNPALGKNSAMAEVVGKMAAEAPVLLQFHDFAEDGRPANYAMLRDRMENIGKLYPQGAQVHYAVCNGRDHAFLCESGFDRANVHLLPNPVCVAEANGQPAAPQAEACEAAVADFSRFPGLEALEAGRPLYLYPTRGIRRKNLGEFLLWAALEAGNDAEGLFATTLEPGNPLARPVYERWVAFARQLRLPAAFAVGQARGAAPFTELMRRAQAVVSTSVAEGFGLAFLEPWLFGKPVLGRDLPDITADFSACGIDLGALYGRLWVPQALIDMDALRQKVATGLERVYGLYQRTLPADAVERSLRSMTDGNGYIDFGRLDESLQEGVITAVASCAQLRAELLLGLAPTVDSERAVDSTLRVSPTASVGRGQSAEGSQSVERRQMTEGGQSARLSAAEKYFREASAAVSAATIATNAAAVERDYGLVSYGERLCALYRQVADSHRTALHYADPALLLDKFLAPERFTLLCS